MRHLHRLLPGPESPPDLPRSQTRRTGRGAAAPEERPVLRQQPQVLPQLQALRSRLPLGGSHRRHHPFRPRPLWRHPPDAARPHAGQHRHDGIPGLPLRPHRQRGAGPGRDQVRDGRRAEDRPPAAVPQVQRPAVHDLVPAQGPGRPGRLPAPGQLLPRLLRQLQLSAAGQGLRARDERARLWRAAPGQGEVLRRRDDERRDVRRRPAQRPHQPLLGGQSCR